MMAGPERLPTQLLTHRCVQATGLQEGLIRREWEMGTLLLCFGLGHKKTPNMCRGVVQRTPGSASRTVQALF